MFLSLTIIITLCNANFGCIGDQSCKDDPLKTCGQFADCKATCDGQAGGLACGNVQFDATQATGYEMWCVSQQDCALITVVCPSSGSCIINCGDNEQGGGGSGGQHCQEATIDCSTAACTINCIFSDSCQNMNILNGNSVTCTGFCAATAPPAASTTLTPTSSPTPSSLGLIKPLPNSAFSASSVFDSAHAPYNAKFNSSSAWGPTNLNNQWLRIDLGAAYVITKIATKGNANIANPFDEWVTQYDLFISLDANSFAYNGTFIGNYDVNTVVEHMITPSVTTQYVEFHPTTYQGWPSMRVEVYGYLADESSASTTVNPTTHPTDSPTNYPSGYPSGYPTDLPSRVATMMPSSYPTTVSPTTASPTSQHLVDSPTEPPTTAADGEAKNTIDNTSENVNGDTKTNDTSSGMDTVAILLIVSSILVVIILIVAVGCCICFQKKKHAKYDHKHSDIEIGNIVPNDTPKTGTGTATNDLKRIRSVSLSGERENLNITSTAIDMNENEDTDTDNDMYNQDDMSPNVNESPGSSEITPGSKPTVGNIGVDFMDINQNENDEGDILNEDENMDEMYDKDNKSKTAGEKITKS